MRKPKHIVSYIVYSMTGCTELVGTFYTKKEMDRYLKAVKATNVVVKVNKEIKAKTFL